MARLVYYCCLDLSRGQEAFVKTSLEQLEGLMKLPPLEVNSPITRLPDGIREKIMQDMSYEKLSNLVERVMHKLDKQIDSVATTDPRRSLLPSLLICCEPGHPLVRLCLSENRHAVWGLGVGRIAFVYEMAEHCALWHELLHTVGASDCYDVKNPQANPGPTCEHPKCIMQYAPHEGIVDGRLPLCKANTNRIREWFAKIKD